MAGCVVKVWLADKAEGPGMKGKFVLIETEFADFGEVVEAVNREGLIVGDMLFTRYSAPGVYMVTDRRPIALSGAAILRVELPGVRYIEGDLG